MAKKKQQWGTTSDERKHIDIGDWRIRTRRFNCDDGTFFFQVKFAKNDWAFTDPTASVFNWHSSPPRKRKQFQSHEEAYNWGREEIKRMDYVLENNSAFNS